MVEAKTRPLVRLGAGVHTDLKSSARPSTYWYQTILSSIYRRFSRQSNLTSCFVGESRTFPAPLDHEKKAFSDICSHSVHELPDQWETRYKSLESQGGGSGGYTFWYEGNGFGNYMSIVLMFRGQTESIKRDVLQILPPKTLR